jgi:hypothetical protein
MERVRRLPEPREVPIREGCASAFDVHGQDSAKCLTQPLEDGRLRAARVEYGAGGG